MHCRKGETTFKWFKIQWHLFVVKKIKTFGGDSMDRL